MEPVFGPILAYNLGGLWCRRDKWNFPRAHRSLHDQSPYSKQPTICRMRLPPTPLYPELPNEPGEGVAGTMLDERGRVGLAVGLEQPLLGHQPAGVLRLVPRVAGGRQDQQPLRLVDVVL